MRMTMMAALLATLGCATVPAESEAGDGEGQVCSVGDLSDLIGRPASQEVGAEALRRSGSRTLRWIRPGDAVTMDYSPHRLNIHLDGRDRVERFACG